MNVFNFLINYFLKLKYNYFTKFCCFLSNNNSNQPSVYILELKVDFSSINGPGCTIIFPILFPVAANSGLDPVVIHRSLMSAEYFLGLECAPPLFYHPLCQVSSPCSVSWLWQPSCQIYAHYLPAQGVPLWLNIELCLPWLPQKITLISSSKEQI